MPVADPESNTEPTTLEGKVLGADGRPLAGATVWFRPIRSDEDRGAVAPKPLIARSGEDGRFSSGEVTGRRFDVRIHAKGYAFWTGRDREASRTLVVTLDRGKPLTGRVLAETTGHGIPGASVRLDDSEAFDLGGPELETSTDDEGYYSFSHAPERTVWIRAVADGRAARLMRGENPAVTGDAVPTVLEEVWLPEGGRVSGCVVDADGKPVAEANVLITAVDGVVGRNRYPTMKARSDDTGCFELDGVSAGTRYRVHAKAEGHSPAVVGPFTIEAGTVLDDVSVILRTGAALRLRLVGPDEQPATDVTIHFESEEDQPSDPSARYSVMTTASGEIEADDDGWLTLRRLLPGTFTVRVEPDGWVGLRREGVVLTEGETTDLGALSVEVGSVLAGRVVDRDNEPVAGARVSARWRDLRGNYSREAISGSGGSFSIAGLPEHSMTLDASADGFASWRLAEAKAGGEGIVVTLDRQGALRGKARLAEGGVPSSFSARAFQGHGSGESSARGGGTAGRFEISGLDPGSYSVEIVSPGRAPGRVHGIKVRGGAVSDAGEILLESGLALRGRAVRDDNGAAVPGARVRLDHGAGPSSWDHEPGYARAVSDARGTFALDGLEPVRYTLTLDHPEFAPVQQSVDLTAEAASEDLEIRLSSGGEIHGTVVDADGLPVTGAFIYMMRGTRGFDRRMATSRADGTFRLSRLAAGTYLLVQSRSRARDSFGSQMKTVEVRNGEVTVVKFVN
jgi:protocatechuate 3,4-dioxygenase beta subunit